MKVILACTKKRAKVIMQAFDLDNTWTPLGIGDGRLAGVRIERAVLFFSPEFTKENALRWVETVRAKLKPGQQVEVI